MSNKTVALAYSKQRSTFGLVGIDPDEDLVVQVGLAKQWSRQQINQIPLDIANAYHDIQWSNMYVDQSLGEHLIKEIKKHNISVNVITTKKNMPDPADIERLLVMDKMEITQFMLSLKLKHRIQFPPKRGKDMQELVNQIELFTEHKTEAGGIDYYSPGDELDNLTKALMICCFGVRNILAGDDGMPVLGPVKRGKRRSKYNPHTPDYKNDSDIVAAYSGYGGMGRYVTYY